MVPSDVCLVAADDFDLDAACFANNYWPHPLRSKLERGKEPDL